jgi:hypothetical protein
MSMQTLALASSPINLNTPGHFLSWSIFDISVANLVVVAVMVAIFALALLLPFPGKHAAASSQPVDPAASDPGRSIPVADDPDSDMWTNKVRRLAMRLLPPGKLLPDRQPAYVRSWIYVFGVATLAALGLVIASGFALALGGPDWWHYNPVGHFFNSIHLWSVELFMAFMVIHLWGKFWMAAWRGRRAMTWITGVVAFLASVIECFTGYLSQSNFDSQWIATNGKDAFNAVGVGAFFNLMNTGQMLMWHIVLLPLVLVAIVGAHVLMVRVRGVSHPLLKQPGWRDRAGRKAQKEADRAAWRGPTRRYDILKEATIATAIATGLVLLMAGLLSSPDVPSLSVQTWAKASPADFIGTSATELDHTSLSGSYGPPYNNGTSALQQVGPISWQKLAGVTYPIDSAKVFVLQPLTKLAPTAPPLAAALTTYTSATTAQQQTWATAYDKAVSNPRVPFNNGDLTVPAAGPVPVMMFWELKMAESGQLDAALLAQHPFYGTDYTKPLLFIADGNYYTHLATSMHLTGGQWGVMNETGSYPGQPWLWLYQLWYHVAPFSTSASVDIWAIYLTGLATLLLLLVPFIPGLRDIPRLIPVHRLIWRNWEPPAPARSAHVAAPDASAQARRR